MQMTSTFNKSVHLKQALSIQPNTGIFNTMRTIIRQDTMAGLWRGVLPTFIRNSLGVGVYFVTLNKLSSFATRFDGSVQDGNMSARAALFAGAFSRSFAVCLLCPLSVVKTRMETIEYSTKYTGVINALRTVGQKEGLRGLFAGLVPTIVRDAPYSALYMLIYLRAKERIGRAFGIKDNRSKIGRSLPTVAQERGPPGSSTAVHAAPGPPVLGAPIPGAKPSKLVEMGVNFVTGAIGGGLATLLTQPQDVIKTRMQLTQRHVPGGMRYGTVRAAARRIFNEEGFYGFFRGASARVLKRMLGSAVTWMIFEETVVRYDHFLSDLKRPKRTQKEAADSVDSKGHGR